MERFRAHRYIQAAGAAGLMHGSNIAWESFGKDRKELDKYIELDEEFREVIIANHEKLREALPTLGLTASIATIGRIIDLMARPEAKFNEYSDLCSELQGRLIDEMEGVLFLSVAPNVARFYEDVNLFGDEVAANFPSTTFDIEEAGKCLALDRGTACVFHLMRVLEVGLYALGRDLGVQPEPNWQNAIDQIQSAINILGKNDPGRTSKNRPQWREKVQFYSEAATQFIWFKDAWRNRTVHAGRTYTVEKARHIFDHICEFMKHIASRLKE
jgi:hypothetical protein